MSSGLSNNSTVCMIQDQYGLVWIGTRDGLNRYNGSDNIIYKHENGDSSSISNNQINCIYEDSRKKIWVGTANGLNLFEGESRGFRNFTANNTTSGISHRYVKYISEDAEGNIWIGTSIGINKYDWQTDTFEQSRIAEFESHSNNIVAIYNDLNDNLWFCTMGGLFILDNQGLYNRVMFAPLLESGKHLFEIRDLKQDHQGIYWLATELYGLFSFSLSNGQPVNVVNYNTRNSDIVADGIRSIHIDKEQNVWLATLEGVSIVDGKSGKISSLNSSGKHPASLSTGSFHDILEDSEGGFWLASYIEGINYYHKQNNLFPHVNNENQSSNSLIDNSINGFLEDISKGIWILTGGGISYHDKRSDSYLHYFQDDSYGLSHDNVKSAAKDKKGNLWIGTYRGLNYFDIETKAFKSFYHVQGEENSLINNQVYAVLVDDYEQVWIGTNGGGLQVYNPELKRFETINTQFNNITSLYEDRNHQLWVGSNYGLECIDQKSHKALQPLAAMDSSWAKISYVNCISEDKEGRLLVGTQNNGLFIIVNNHVFNFDERNGLLSNTINAIEEDNNGYYWISTNNGISRLEVQIEDGGTHFMRSINFDVYHGLQNKQFYPNSSLMTSDGMLYFGGVNGFNAFYPGRIEKQFYFPPVTIFEFDIYDNKKKNYSLTYPMQSIDTDSSIILDYKQRQVFIKFVGVNYVTPNELYYKYMLTGENESWIDLEKQRSINFTFLPIGDHELRLKSTTDPTIWGDDFTSLKITVLPPWWITPWAYMLYLAVIALLLYMFFRYSLLWARLKTNLQMEQFQREKEHELLESKLRFFTDISHELRTPLTLIIAPLDNIISQIDINNRFRNKLLMMQRNGNRMMQLINQVLDMRKLETGNEKLRIAKGNVVAFIKEICLAFEGISDHKNINFSVSSESEDIQLWYDRDKLEIVFYNLLSNAFKHTPENGNIFVRITQVKSEELPQKLSKNGKKGAVKIVVSDSGSGIAEADIENIFNRFFSEQNDNTHHPTGIGLELSKRMVDLHKGCIDVQSRRKTNENHGSTSFEVYLLKGKRHFDAAEILTDFKSSEDISQYTKDLLLKEEKTAATEFQTNSDRPKSKYGKKTILIVEDNPEVRDFIIDLLNDEYTVEEAEDGKQGLMKAIQNGPDLIISDIMMPEINGIELCKQVKLDTRTSHIPVILLTARTAITFKFEGFETGADEYITKPFSASFLKLRIRNLLDQREVIKNYLRTNAIIEPGEISITSVDEKLLKKAVDYITENISNTNITVNEISAELGLSRVHFYRKMKALTNLTATEFIRNVRLRRACVLLQQNKFNIKEVKNLVGFENADYFRKCFKEEYGVTPSEYAAKFEKPSSFKQQIS